jgi:predicted flap endonuclease-1-like 5' DNA nuclease
MRSDYALYTVAIIFFILTGIVLAYQVELKELWTVTTVVLGLLFIGLGYSQRPRATTIETSTVPTAPTTITEKETQTAIEAASTAMVLTEVKGIGEKRAKQLTGLGINGIEDLAEASAEDLAAKLKISPKITGKWIGNAKKLAEKS